MAKGKLGIENTLGSSKLLPCLHCQERWLIKASWCYTNFCFFWGGRVKNKLVHHIANLVVSVFESFWIIFPLLKVDAIWQNVSPKEY